MNQLKNEKVNKCYNKKLANEIAKIDPTENLEEHARKTEVATERTAKRTIFDRRSAMEPWIFEETLKHTKNASTQKEQQYEDLCKKVKKSARQEKERWAKEQYEGI